MNQAVSPAILLSAIRAEREMRNMETSLAEFAKQAWKILEPSTELKWGWALDAICEHLEAVTDGEITRLLMNVPPGSMKSLLTGVLWPAWEWGPKKLSGLRYLSTAHKQDLAVRDNLKCRRLIMSPWFQERWTVNLVGDQNAKTKFENDKTGFREAMSFTSMTGSRGDRVILDDPLSVDDATSDQALANAETTFREALPTRVNNDESAIVVIMQRLHEKDTSGIIINERLGYEHLMLPMRFEEARRCKTSIGFVDPRKTEGELMFPERFSERMVESLERTLGTYATAGQLQQRPSPAGGGILKIKFFKLWPAGKPLPLMQHVVQSYDTAYTKDTMNDPTAHTAWGVFEHGGAMNAVLLDAWAEHLESPELRRRVIKDWHAEYGGTPGNALLKPRKADVVLVEKKSSGQSLLQDLRQARVPCVPYEPAGNDKVARARNVAPILELECIWIIESNKDAGQAVKWARPFLSQVERFPNDENDDYVDTFTQAMIYLRDSGWLEMPQADLEPVAEVDYYKQKQLLQNPYGV